MIILYTNCFSVYNFVLEVILFLSQDSTKIVEFADILSLLCHKIHHAICSIYRIYCIFQRFQSLYSVAKKYIQFLYLAQ